MKDRKTGKTKAERASGAQGKPDTAQAANPSGGIVKNSGAQSSRIIPVWVHESDLEDLAGNFDPSPLMYDCACAFIWDETEKAISNGDSDLLSRNGVADALQYITRPENAGTNAAAVAFIREEFERIAETRNAIAEKERKSTEDEKRVRRLLFVVTFDETKKPYSSTIATRRYYLDNSPYMAGLIRTARAIFEKAKTPEDLKQACKLIDTIYESKTPLKGNTPAKIRAAYLNRTFAMAGEALARWLSLAIVPEFQSEVDEIRKRIADNFGIFPAPFGCEGDLVFIENDALQKIFFMSRALSKFNGDRPGNSNGRGITITAFAHLMKVSPRTVQNWISGKTTPPTVMGVKFTREILKDRARAAMFAYNYKQELELNRNGCIKSDGAELENHLQDMAALKNGIV